MAHSYFQNQRRIRNSKSSDNDLKFTPGAFKYMRENGIEKDSLLGIVGTGKNRYIKKSDVEKFITSSEEEE